eukprot:Clim_evm21s232 gene=Clim_evmTU21s232
MGNKGPIDSDGFEFVLSRKQKQRFRKAYESQQKQVPQKSDTTDTNTAIRSVAQSLNLSLALGQTDELLRSAWTDPRSTLPATGAEARHALESLGCARRRWQRVATDETTPQIDIREDPLFSVRKRVDIALRRAVHGASNNQSGVWAPLADWRSKIIDGHRIVIVGYGIGCFSKAELPALQLAFLVDCLRPLLRKVLCELEPDGGGTNQGPSPTERPTEPSIDIELFDPMQTAGELSALELLDTELRNSADGGRDRLSFIPHNEGGERCCKERQELTVFYMPHCPARLYDRLMAVNWDEQQGNGPSSSSPSSSSCTGNRKQDYMIIIGNSLCDLASRSSPAASGSRAGTEPEDSASGMDLFLPCVTSMVRSGYVMDYGPLLPGGPSASEAVGPARAFVDTHVHRFS